MKYELTRDIDDKLLFKSEYRMAFLSVYVTSIVIFFCGIASLFFIYIVLSDTLPHPPGIINKIAYTLFLSMVASAMIYRSIIIYYRNAACIEFSNKDREIIVHYMYPMSKKVVSVDGNLYMELQTRGNGHLLKVTDRKSGKCVFSIEIEQCYEAAVELASLVNGGVAGSVA
ncbi:MAG: hypothetical protein KDA78_04340 [Planctomycetaceae bacterium]|nr:hypothetical protein [Planctomycetaceae bacterium]